MSSNYTTNLMHKGVWPLIILSILKRGDMYSRELVDSIPKYSGGIIRANYNTIYPILIKLTDHGLVSSRKVRKGKRMEVVYYHIEPAGEEHLSKLLQDYERINEGIFQIIHYQTP